MLFIDPEVKDKAEGEARARGQEQNWLYWKNKYLQALQREDERQQTFTMWRSFAIVVGIVLVVLWFIDVIFGK